MTTVYDNSVNCIKLHEIQNYRLYYSYATQTYIIINIKDKEYTTFTHVHKLTVYSNGESVGGYYATRLSVVLELDIVYKNITSKCHISYTAPQDTNKLQSFYNTRIIDTLSNIIVNGNPQGGTVTERKGFARLRRPEIDLLDINDI